MTRAKMYNKVEKDKRKLKKIEDRCLGVQKKLNIKP